MSAVPFHYIDLRTFCYATEDIDRVESALRTFLPEDYEIEAEESEGHYGDPIIVLSTRVDTADDMRYVLDRVRGLEELDRVVDDLEERIDEDCSFFLQLDKQAAYEGQIRLGNGIMLRGKVEAYPAKKSSAVTNAREALS